MVALRWSVSLLLVLALACTQADASCVAGDVCCANCATECPDLNDMIECTSLCPGVECSKIQEAQCGSGKVCCDDCDVECPSMPKSCESSCFTVPPPLSCPKPAAECSMQGAVRCEDCAKKCPGHPALCEKFCRGEPTADPLDCLKLGEDFAEVWADRVCAETKAACGLDTFATFCRHHISLGKCCRVVIGKCAGNIVKGFQDGKFTCKPDEPGNYGTCIDADGFEREYTKKAEAVCKTQVCSIQECLEALADDECKGVVRDTGCGD